MKKIFATLAIFGAMTFGFTSNALAQDEFGSDEATETVDESTTDESAAAPAEAAKPEEKKAEAAATTETKTEDVSMFKALRDKFIEGGAGFMSFVALCLILGLALCIERIVYLSLASVNSKKLLEDIEDSLNEDEHMPVPGLVHRYPDRVLMLVSMTCGSYCRFCTRNRVVGTRLQTGPTKPLSKYYENQLAYVRANKNIRDVLLSGGDPLLIPMRTLDWLLTELHKIDHVEVVRIGSRVPIFLPQRITRELCTMLASHHPLWLNTHVNHPNELTPDSCAALARLADSGIPLGCQTVLLAGVNDCPNIMMELVHKLVKNRVRPYYIYQCDLVVGASHFRTPVTKLIEIMEALRGHTSGFCVPTGVIDAPHGGGKVPIMPNYLISQSETKTIVRNFEGFISTYTGPRTYKAHNPRTCKYCIAASKKDDPQEGVSGLLKGNHHVIKPEGWDNAHLSRRELAPKEIREEREKNKQEKK